MTSSFPRPPAPIEPTIRCPRCSHEMKLADSLAGPVVERIKAGFKERLDEKEALFEREREALRRDAEQTARARLEIDDEVARRLGAERRALASAEARKAREAVEEERAERERELSELRETVRTNDAQLAEAHRCQADALRKQREFDLARAELELTMQRRVDAALAEIRVTARRESDEGARLRVAERDRTIATMAKTIEELRRQAEQGSQRRQGEALEIELETELRAKFPADAVEPVANGEAGADVVQHVNGKLGRSAGQIIWETKRTKSFNEQWLPKLREDQRRSGADVAVIVTQTLPRRVEHFDFVEGVWICHPRYAVPIGIALRQAADVREYRELLRPPASSVRKPSS